MTQLDATLADLAQKLGVSAARLWPEMVAVIFWQALFWAIFDPIAVLIGVLMSVRYYRLANRNGWQDAEFVLPAFVVLFITGMIVLLALVTYPDIVAGLTDPEGYAAWQLVHHAK